MTRRSSKCSALVVLSIAMSVALLLGVERLHTQTRTSFANTLSGTDLIVGARSSPINLLLYSVFRIGDARSTEFECNEPLAVRKIWNPPRE